MKDRKGEVKPVLIILRVAAWRTCFCLTVESEMPEEVGNPLRRICLVYASERGHWKAFILGCTDENIDSNDFVGDSRSSIFDAKELDLVRCAVFGFHCCHFFALAMKYG